MNEQIGLPDQGSPAFSAEMRELMRLAARALETELDLQRAHHTPIVHSSAALRELIGRERLEGFTLRHHQEIGLPDRLREDLKTEVQNLTSAQLRVNALSVRISRVTEEAGLNVLFFKGWPLSLLLGAQEELRGGVDVDVLVRPSDVPLAHRALTEAGYIAQYSIGPRSYLGWRFVTFRNREMSYRSPAGEVDLHWRVTSEHGVLPEAGTLLQRSVTITDGRHDIRTLSPTDALAATAFHFYLDYCHSIRRLIDFARLLGVAEPAVFNTLSSAARQAVSDVTALLETLFGIRPPHALALPPPVSSNVEYMETLLSQWHWVDPTSSQAPSRVGAPWGRNFRHLRRYSQTLPLIARLVARGAVWFPPREEHPRPIGMIQAALWQVGRLLRGKTESHI